MPWSIIQIKKKKGKRAIKEIEVAPSGWIKNGFVYWPPNNQVTLQRNEASMIDLDEWIPYECKVFIEGLADFTLADRKANEFKPIHSDVDTYKRKCEAYSIDDGTGLKSLPEQIFQDPESMSEESEDGSEKLDAQSSASPTEHAVEPLSYFVQTPSTIFNNPNALQGGSIVQSRGDNVATTMILTPDGNIVPATQVDPNISSAPGGTNEVTVGANDTAYSFFNLLPNENDLGSVKSDIASLKEEIGKMRESLQTFMDAQPAVLAKLMVEMDIMKKGMNLIMDGLANKDTAELTSSDTAEDFTTCATFTNIETAEELKQLETFITDIINRAQMCRFIKKEIPKSVYKEGRSYFTAVFRYLIQTKMLLPYTWKTVADSKLAFKAEFAVFVSFLSEFVMKEYPAMQVSDVEKSFSERMQYKLVDYKRQMQRLESGKEERKTSTRAFAQRVPKKSTANGAESSEIPSEKPAAPAGVNTTEARSTDA